MWIIPLISIAFPQAKVEGGFWYCPECTKNGQAPKVLEHFEDECESDEEPSQIKAGNIIVSTLKIPGKKQKTKRAPSQSTAPSFSPPNAYLEALGVDQANGYDSALSAQSEQSSGGYAPSPYGELPRGPLSSARTPSNLPPWSMQKGLEEEHRPGTRGAITAMVGPSGLWSARTYGFVYCMFDTSHIKKWHTWQATWLSSKQHKGASSHIQFSRV